MSSTPNADPDEPPKKSAGKKLSKAEKEKLKKEEAERKALEEEENKAKAEREASERRERDKQEAEEKRRLENEERKKRKGQLLELEDIWDSNCATLTNEQIQRRKDAKWARYMRCDGSPDPTIAGEINTYMNLWREDRENTGVDVILKDSELTLSLIAELEFLLEDTPPEEITEKEVIRYRATLVELQELLQEKLDLGSHYLLLNAKSQADPETSNLEQVKKNSGVTICMWGNLSKNPRIKSVTFPEKGFTFDLSKQMTLSDVAVRVMFTKYDHLSPLCKTFMPRIKKPTEEPPAAEPAEEENVGEEQKTEGEEGEGEKKEGEEEEEEKKETEDDKPEVEKEETTELMASLREMEEGVEQTQDAEPEPEPEPMEEDYDIKTPEPPQFEDFDGDEDVIDLRAYHVMGGLFHFNLLHLPPQPKQMNEWTITQLVEPPTLEYMEYTADDPALGVSMNSTAKTEGKEEDGEKKEKRDEKPSIGVHMKLPQDVYFCEEPQVVRWDPTNNEWKLDGISDNKFNEEERTLSFKTSSYGILTLMQDAHINMPFQSWELRPRTTNWAILTIIAAIVEVEIEIKDDKCCINVPEEKAELAHLKNNWMPVKDFIKALQASGLNVFPQQDSNKYVSVQEKNIITEERLYQQMALTASCMAYSWSKWNMEVKDAEKVVAQGSEHLTDEALLEEDWSLFLITKKRTTKLKMTEFDEEFSEDHAEGTEFHADLYHMTMDIASKEGQERVRNTDYKFVDTVHQLIRATRLVTFS